MAPASTRNTGVFARNEFYSNVKRLPALFSSIHFSKSINTNLLFESGLDLQNFRFYEEGLTEPLSKLQSYTENYIYLTIPLNMIIRQPKFYLGGGLNISHFLQRRQVKNGELNVLKEPRPTGQLNYLDYWLFGLNAKMGKEWSFGTRHSFQAELFATFANPYFVAQGFNAVGIQLGFKFAA